MREKFIVSTSPHIKQNISTRGLMLNVVFALLPTLVVSGLIFGARAWLLIGVTVAACVGFEALYNIVMKKGQTVGDFSAVVTGIILAFNYPATLPLYMAIIGAFAAIVITKMLFGGLGFNFANPALVGRCVLFVSFAAYMADYAYPQNTKIDALASATPLALGGGINGTEALLPLLTGVYGGVLGETCAITLLLGGIYLVATKTISAAIPLSFVGTVAVMSLLFGQDIIVQVFSGGLLLGAIFMATDYVTSPFTLHGKIVYGIGLGLITCLIRFWGNYSEGVSFALLIMNIIVPYINTLTRQKPLGGVTAK